MSNMYICIHTHIYIYIYTYIYICRLAKVFNRAYSIDAKSTTDEALLGSAHYVLRPFCLRCVCMCLFGLPVHMTDVSLLVWRDTCMTLIEMVVYSFTGTNVKASVPDMHVK
jgi:hypothetical protein